MAGGRRVLILAPQLPYPPHQGATLRNYNLIRHLAQRHLIDLVCFRDPGQPLPAETPLVEFCQHIETQPTPTRSLLRRARDTLFSPLPDMALRLVSPAMHEVVRRLTDRQSYDVVQVEGIEMMPYVLHLQDNWPACLLFDNHNAEYVLQRRAFFTDLRNPSRWIAAAYSFAQWLKLRRFEALCCRSADAVVAVSEADRRALARLAPDRSITVVPNGVDVAHYADYRYEAAEDAPRLQQPALVFSGKMDFRPNVDAVLWFMDYVWPRLKAARPDVTFYVVGQQPHQRLLWLYDTPGTVLTGQVPDIRPYLAQAAVYVVPMRIGGGTRLKLLEAMAMALPIVSTPLGAEGFPVEDRAQLRLAEAPLGFVAAVLDVLGNPQRAQATGKAGQAMVREMYDWAHLVPGLEALYA